MTDTIFVLQARCHGSESWDVAITRDETTGEITRYGIDLNARTVKEAIRRAHCKANWFFFQPSMHVRIQRITEGEDPVTVATQSLRDDDAEQVVLSLQAGG